MGRVANIAISADLSKFKRAFSKFCKKNKFTTSFSQEHYKKLASGEGVFIHINEINEQMFIFVSSTDSDNFKKELPRSSRKLKTAKNFLYVSMPAREGNTPQMLSHNQWFLIDLIQCQENFGYIKLDDCGYGSDTYIEVDANGFISSKIRSKDPHIANMTKFAHSIPNNNVQFLKAEDLKTIDKEDIRKVYFKKYSRDLSPNQTVKNYTFYDEMYVLTKSRPQPLKIERTYTRIHGDTLGSVEGVEEFLDLPKSLLVDYSNKILHEVFPLN